MRPRLTRFLLFNGLFRLFLSLILLLKLQLILHSVLVIVVIVQFFLEGGDVFLDSLCNHLQIKFYRLAVIAEFFVEECFSLNLFVIFADFDEGFDL